MNQSKYVYKVVSREPLCMSKSLTQRLTEWQGHVLSSSGQLKIWHPTIYERSVIVQRQRQRRNLKGRRKMSVVTFLLLRPRVGAIDLYYIAGCSFNLLMGSASFIFEIVPTCFTARCLDCHIMLGQLYWRNNFVKKKLQCVPKICNICSQNIVLW